MAPKKTIEKLVTRKLSVNKAALTMLSRANVMSKNKLLDTAVTVIRSYKAKYREEIDSGATQVEASDEAIAGKKLMVSRVQNAVVSEVAKGIKSQYRGEFYVWLPSDAAEPDPLHQLKYGKTFQIGRGEMPGDRIGCKCGMNILVNETRLKLGSE